MSALANRIHATAIVEGDVRLADDVTIGPHCVLTGPITIGVGTRLRGHAYLNGPLTIGQRNVIYPHVTLGFAPQDLKWDADVSGAGLVIGDGNTFREGVSIHRASSHETPTTIGDNNYWMANSHAGHDCTVANNCVFANGTLLAGFVRVDDKVITGGNSTVHQFCRVGRGAFLSGVVGMTLDLPPWFMLTGINVAGSINLKGMRRAGMSAEDINAVRWVYTTLYRRGMPPKKAVEMLRDRIDRPIVREYIQFIEGSKRGICLAKGKPARNTALAVPEAIEPGDKDAD